MPDFAIISLQEARLRTLSGRQAQYFNQYAEYIQQLGEGQAGKLHVSEQERHTTIRRRLTVTAQMLGISLTIKRSGEDIYFWKAGEAAAQPRRRPTRRRRSQEETTTSDQPFREPEEVDY